MDAIDKLVPTRPAMPKVSRLIHNSAKYNACIVSAGLVVQSNRTGTGKLMPTSHPQYADYFDAIENPIDADEADHICAVFLR